MIAEGWATLEDLKTRMTIDEIYELNEVLDEWILAKQAAQNQP